MDNSEDFEIGRRTWERSMDPIEKDGYREGVTAGRDAASQEGFDIGYKYGFELGYHTGLLKAKKRFKKWTSEDPKGDLSNNCIICSSNKIDLQGLGLQEIIQRQKEFMEKT